MITGRRLWQEWVENDYFYASLYILLSRIDTNTYSLYLLRIVIVYFSRFCGKMTTETNRNYEQILFWGKPPLIADSRYQIMDAVDTHIDKIVKDISKLVG